MARKCAWCDSFISPTSVQQLPVSHVLCTGCLADLQVALADAHLRCGGSVSGGSSQKRC